MRRALAVATALLAAAPAPAAWAHSRCFVLPYGGLPTSPWWSLWSAEPLVAANLLLAAVVYARGVHRLWRLGGPGRGISRGRAAAFGLGMGTLALALLSPVDVLSGELAWVHMVQHMTLMVVAAPLLMLGRPGLAVFWALPAPWRRRLSVARRSLFTRRALFAWFWHPVGLWAIFALVLWLWHLPALYEAALRLSWVHDMQHLAFFGAGCLFWRVLADPLGRRWLPPLLGVVYLFTTSLHATLLGLFMALAPRPWYPSYALSAPRWGLSAIADQQLAGLIMWMPACMVFAVAALWLLGGWLQPLKAEPDPPEARAQK
jgi:putative membrane protein